MFCEAISHLLLTLSRITVTTLLIGFGFGWQVIYENTIDMQKKIHYIYLFVLFLAAYDDMKMSEWLQEHPADLFHLMQSNIQWTFYATKMVEYALFIFAVWRSQRVNAKKLFEAHA
jgi:hypothetical protein